MTAPKKLIYSTAKSGTSVALFAEQIGGARGKILPDVTIMPFIGHCEHTRIVSFGAEHILLQFADEGAVFVFAF